MAEIIMPKETTDKNGNRIRVGDYVNIPVRIVDIVGSAPHEAIVGVAVESNINHPQGTQLNVFAAQVYKIEQEMKAGIPPKTDEPTVIVHVPHPVAPHSASTTAKDTK